MALIDELIEIRSSYSGQAPSTGKQVEDAFNQNFRKVAEKAAQLEEDKVGKVPGMGLSEESYSTEEQQKLAGISPGAQVNEVSTQMLTTHVDNKFVHIIPLTENNPNYDSLINSGLYLVTNTSGIKTSYLLVVRNSLQREVQIEFGMEGGIIRKRTGQFSVSFVGPGSWTWGDWTSYDDQITQLSSDMTDIYEKLYNIPTSMIYQPDVADLEELEEISNPQKFWAVRVLDQVDADDNAYIYQYDGSAWSRTPFTVFPSDVATRSNINSLISKAVEERIKTIVLSGDDEFIWSKDVRFTAITVSESISTVSFRVGQNVISNIVNYELVAGSMLEVEINLKAGYGKGAINILFQELNNN